jgi:hypothetical protein
MRTETPRRAHHDRCPAIRCHRDDARDTRRATVSGHRATMPRGARFSYEESCFPHRVPDDRIDARRGDRCSPAMRARDVMRIERHRAAITDDDAAGPVSRAHHDRRIANHHLLRIAMHFGASYIRDADIRGPSAHQQSTPSSISQSTAFALHDHSRRQRAMVPLTSRNGRCRTTGCRGANAGTVRRNGRRTSAHPHWLVLWPPQA